VLSADLRTTQTAAQRRGRLGVHVSGGFPESSAALAFVASVDSRTLPAAQPAEGNAYACIELHMETNRQHDAAGDSSNNNR
jgi:hypothetical protein